MIPNNYSNRAADFRGGRTCWKDSILAALHQSNLYKGIVRQKNSFINENSSIPENVKFIETYNVKDIKKQYLLKQLSWMFLSQIKGPEKTLEERRSSLDAEIDSLTSILADLESSSPYKPRGTQVHEQNLTPSLNQLNWCSVVLSNQTVLISFMF